MRAAHPRAFLRVQDRELRVGDAGVCHVGLTFAGGFTYSADVTFFEQSQGCGPPLIQPSQGALAVSNPSTTCLEAGLDQD